MGRGIALLMLVVLSGGSGLAWAAADLKEGVKELADKITKSMVEKGRGCGASACGRHRGPGTSPAQSKSMWIATR